MCNVLKGAICSSSFYLSRELKECSSSLRKSFSLGKPPHLPFPSPFCTFHLSHCSVSSLGSNTQGWPLPGKSIACSAALCCHSCGFLSPQGTAPPHHWLPLASHLPPPTLLSPAPSEPAAILAYDVPVMFVPFTNRNLKNGARATCQPPQGQLPPGFHTNTFSFTGHPRSGIRAAAREPCFSHHLPG